MVFKCEYCWDTGFYGDNGPGIRGNREWQTCEMCESGYSARLCIEAYGENKVVSMLGGIKKDLTNTEKVNCCDKGKKLIDYATCDNYSGPTEDGYCIYLGSQGDGYYESISFCPWCGTKVPDIEGDK